MQLTADLAAIEAALLAFEQGLTPAYPADMAQFAQRRVRLAQSVNAFIAQENERVSALDLLGLSSVSHEDRQAVHRKLMTLRQRYSAHIAEWNTAALQARWSDYHRDTVALIAAMRDLLAVRARLAVRLAA